MTERNKEQYFKQFEDELIPNNVADTLPLVLPEEIRAQLDQWLQRYPKEQRQSGVFEALRLVQELNGGSLTVPWMDAVADFLNMPPIEVYEVAAFYTMFRLKPVGKYVLDICTNISCGLNGADELMAHAQKKLGIKINETTADNLFTLKEVECLGACVAAPVCQIGNDYYEQLTPEKFDAIVAKLRDS